MRAIVPLAVRISYVPTDVPFATGAVSWFSTLASFTSFSPSPRGIVAKTSWATPTATVSFSPFQTRGLSSVLPPSATFSVSKNVKP